MIASSCAQLAAQAPICPPIGRPRTAPCRHESNARPPYPLRPQVAISSREERHALVSSEPAFRCSEGRATRRNSLIVRPIRRIRRRFCHRAVVGSIQTPDHDRPPMFTSSKFVASPKRPSIGVVHGSSFSFLYTPPLGGAQWPELSRGVLNSSQRPPRTMAEVKNRSRSTLTFTS